uniref:GrBNV_gp28-like protein n=1 Tax=Nilaparvata lugens endogenous nudivirus TaxID=1487700 RepID=X5GYC2_9VIRU|nr:GrBNV_gp28-like protein [Nilaparvata lugens endogenous nudivirus]
MKFMKPTKETTTKLNRNLREFKKDVMPLTFPNVGCNAKSGLRCRRFQFSSEAVVDEDLTTNNDKDIIYPASFDLVSLKKLSSELDQSCKWVLAPSKTGHALKTLSEDLTTINRDTHSFTNYYVKNSMDSDLTCYPLVYGAVAKKYSDVAKHFMNIMQEQYEVRVKSGKTCSGTPLQHEKYNYAHFADGELEILVHSYWQLETTDLLQWRSDVPRQKLKAQFTAMWLELRLVLESETRKIQQSPEAPLPKSLVDLKKAVDSIRKFAKFDSKLVTAASLLIVKVYFSTILCVSNPEARKRWCMFMKNCKLHHYLCEHTQYAIMQMYKAAAPILKSKFDQMKAIENETRFVVPILSIANIFEIFSNVLSPKHRKGVRELQAVCNNLLYTVARSIGFHMLYHGIVDGTNVIITERHLSGFIGNRMPYKKSPPPLMPHLTATKVNIIENIIDTTIKTNELIVDRTKKVKCDKDAKVLLGSYMRYVLFAATVGPLSHFASSGLDDGSNSSKSWAKILTSAVDSYLETYFCDIRRIDEIPIVADIL